jgi:hypothetical protein
MADTDARPVDYKTHILIGVRANGVMTVICDWPHVPTQADVQEEMEGARDGYVAFALCTPTSIIAVDDDSGGAKGGSRFGRLG